MLTLIENYINEKPQTRQGAFLFLDMEKAFDRVSYTFLTEAIQALGFGPNFQKAVGMLYCLLYTSDAADDMQCVDLEFSDDGIDTIANIASEVNATVENIGARRLHTIIEKILDDISFTATDRAGEKIIINKDYINKNLDNLVKDTDLSKFIL